MEKLSVKDAMERLNVAETTIRRMIKRGDLPNIERVDRKIWIPLGDIEAYEQRQSLSNSEFSVEPTSSPPPDSDAANALLKSIEPGSKPEAEETREPEEAQVIAAPKPRDILPESASTPDAHATIAQPIDELDDGTESVTPPDTAAATETSSEPAPYSSRAAQSQGEQEQSFTWIAVQAGIMSTKWLEEIFHSIRVALEKYKQKAFPRSDDK